MTRTTHTPTRGLGALVIGATLAATVALPVSAMDYSQIEMMPRHYSEASFNQLSEHDIHMIDVAQKRGQRVLIGDRTPSESRAYVDQALNSGDGMMQVTRSGS
ncbi:hypothetical protein BXY70_2506 [Roseovarius halotolerans]|uniref:Uncharacterized protein n=1 Tax=Roseovarius halotolerans TaxID=505353 RepID=A0A1X6ZC09_9RHOB|nr:hypothetical protein [Roseovarius halotolerans]RKT30517.1 hypothetical protein BXY70_2506 [Roseovarius halotolerans]SLN45239.1 hypothetical protein ROH8110_02403 [Roseovarius halotolerans]